MYTTADNQGSESSHRSIPLTRFDNFSCICGSGARCETLIHKPSFHQSISRQNDRCDNRYLTLIDSLCIDHFTRDEGGIIRGDTTRKIIHLVFTGGDYSDGGMKIRETLLDRSVKAHFFFTGDFYRNVFNASLIRLLIEDGHYLGAHSDKHLLYASWSDRDSTLVTREEFMQDLCNNYKAMAEFGIFKHDAPIFLPPFEWYNKRISRWTEEFGLTLINFTPGTTSNADYTTPEMANYLDSETILKNILTFEEHTRKGLNGFFLLLHIGTHPARTDKLYDKLDDLLQELAKKGYRFELFCE